LLFLKLARATFTVRGRFIMVVTKNTKSSGWMMAFLKASGVSTSVPIVVLIADGEITETLTSVFMHSCLKASVKPIKPNFEAQYAEFPAVACSPKTADIYDIIAICL
jgi:hypothetical protein